MLFTLTLPNLIIDHVFAIEELKTLDIRYLHLYTDRSMLIHSLKDLRVEFRPN